MSRLLMAKAISLVLLLAPVASAAMPMQPASLDSSRTSTLTRRAIIKNGDYLRIGNSSVPLTPLLLIFVALAFALVALVFSILNVWCVNSRIFRGSRTIIAERERAKQDLAVRGASSRPGSNSGSPTPGTPRRFPPNKLPRKLGSMGPPNSGRSSPDKKPRRSYRGTSFSLADARKNSDKTTTTSSSRIGMHDLQVLDLESASSGSFLVNSRDFGAADQAAKYPITLASSHRGSFAARNSTSSNPPLVFGTKNFHRTSSSTSRGADLIKIRSRTSSIPVHPKLMERTYLNDPQRDANRHPLEGSSELRRHATDPSGGSRRNSTLSVLESSSSAELSWLDSSIANSRIGSFSLANGQPLQPFSWTGTGSGQLSSGSLSPLGTGAATPNGLGTEFGRLPPSSRAYESDDGDAIEAATKLLSGTRKESNLR